MNRSTVKLIASDIEKALADVAAKHNVEIKRGNATFNTDNMVLKLNIARIDSNGAVLSREATDFEVYKSSFGINKDMGDSFYYKGAKYTITGLKYRSKKYPVIATNGNASYKFPVRVINNSPSEIN